jgi:D-alanyl-D-alanine carboxypeptidase
MTMAAGCAGTPGDSGACRVDQAYEGPQRRSTPDDVWERDRGRSIEGSLEVGLEAKLDEVFEGLLEHYPAASVAVAIPGEGMWVRTGGASVDEDSLFQVASTTKAYTAAMVLQLVEEGRLSLDDTVDAWFPAVPKASSITVRGGELSAQ